MQICQTKRLKIRVFEPTDLEPMTAINQDPKVCQYLPGIGTRQTTQLMIAQILSHYQQHHFSLYALELRENGVFIGFTGLMHVHFKAHFTPAVEISWRLGSAHWGNGYATEAAIAVRDLAFATLKLDRLVSFTAVNNMRSRRVMANIGMYYNANDDFNHPALKKREPLSRHVLYQLKKTHRTLT